MERYHDTSRDPLPLVSPQHEIERQRLADATAAFLASGGQVQQVGFQMKAAPETFVINAKKTPVYAHLFVRPDDEPLCVKPEPKPVPQHVTDAIQELRRTSLSVRLMVQATLGATPAQAARSVGIPEKRARQIARDHNIKFKRQR